MQGTVTFRALSAWLPKEGYIRWKVLFIVVPSPASRKPTEHEGVRNFTTVGNVMAGQNSIFRKREVILSEGLVHDIFFLIASAF